LSALLAAPALHAEPPYSDYERESIEQALTELHAEIEPDPEGKIIEGIDIVRLDVFDERDPIPDFFNIFHVRSREYVIRRELLFDVGAPYATHLVDESARNLRDVKQLSVVLLLPLRGSRRDRVRVLVITKDVWSLRLNSDFQIVNHDLTYLLLNPSEENVLGTHASAGALFILEPDTYSLGALFTHPRVAGSRFRLGLSGNVIFNRESGDPEGSFGSFYYGKPLYSLGTRWAYETAVVWHREIERRFIGLEPVTFDALVTPGDDAIPYVYNADRLLAAYEVTRSFGRRFKFDISGGLEADRRVFRAPDLAGFQPAAVAEFVNDELPVSDTRISPFVQLRAYRSDYLRTLDVESLGLQEDFRLGHEVLLRVYPASSELGSTRDMLGTLSALSCTQALGDGLIRVVAASTIEFEFNGRHDATREALLRIVTPRLGFGRLVHDAVIVNRYQNYLNTQFAVGGADRLRGYPPDLFLGKDVIANNLEFRSRGIDILSAQVGASLFYDVADAFDGFDDLKLKHSVGLGVRMVFPQANRTVFRAEWGFPLTQGVVDARGREITTFPGSVIFTFRQAFPVPAKRPPTVTDLFSRRVE
jgi:hypothetical protein